MGGTPCEAGAETDDEGAADDKELWTDCTSHSPAQLRERKQEDEDREKGGFSFLSVLTALLLFIVN